MISLTSRGSFNNIDAFLARMKARNIFDALGVYGQLGCDALASATPTDSGLTADSWTYKVKASRGVYSIVWHNTNLVSGIPVAILLQYGHATGTGGWVEGLDYINPALKPIFDKIANDVWEKVKT